MRLIKELSTLWAKATVHEQEERGGGKYTGGGRTIWQRRRRREFLREYVEGRWVVVWWWEDRRKAENQGVIESRERQQESGRPCLPRFPAEAAIIRAETSRWARGGMHTMR